MEKWSSSVTQKPRFYARARVLKRTFFVALPFFLVLLFGFLSYLPVFNIATIELVGATIVKQSEVTHVVEPLLATPIKGIFSRRNVLLYPKSEIERALKKELPRLASVHVRVGEKRELIVDVTERKASSLWCGKEPLSETNELLTECYYIDKDAILFARAPYFSGSVYMKWYGPISDELDPLGTQYLDKDKFHSLESVVNGMENLGITPLALVPKKNGEYELWLDPGLDRTNGLIPRMLFGSEIPFAKVVSDFSVALANPPLKDRFKAEYGKLEYIDLRFLNKVYYKFTKTDK